MAKKWNKSQMVFIANWLMVRWWYYDIAKLPIWNIFHTVVCLLYCGEIWCNVDINVWTYCMNLWKWRMAIKFHKIINILLLKRKDKGFGNVGKLSLIEYIETIQLTKITSVNESIRKTKAYWMLILTHRKWFIYNLGNKMISV